MTRCQYCWRLARNQADEDERYTIDQIYQDLHENQMMCRFKPKESPGFVKSRALYEAMRAKGRV